MGASLTAEEIVKLFEEDVKARRRLAELLVIDEDVRLAIINAVVRDVATKHDLDRLGDELRAEFRAEIARLEARLGGVERELSGLRERVARVEGALSQMAERLGDLDKRIDALDKRIDSLEKGFAKRIEALEKSVDKRMEEMSKRMDELGRRIDEMGKRLDYTTRMTMILAGSVVATLAATIILRLLLGG